MLTNTKPHATKDSSSHSYGIVRFLADQQQYHPVFGKVQSPAEVKVFAEARMTAELHAFEQQFGPSGKPSSS
ncbi:hypothetical protein N5P37_010534 [Trichoderma harzianum]|nr:hypothetical protein N5P37_010534 [Trichoderma harzianum]